ncbi:MAG: polymerase [Paenibacillaceae bacterium]|nr:polymerase [Paenibacillaceae bacterium]
MPDKRVLPVEYYLSIQVSDDKLCAYLQFVNTSDDFACSREQLDQLLVKNHIVHGVKEEVLDQIALNPAAYFEQPVLIAEGTAPVNGKDGYIQNVFNLDSDQKKPLELEDGRVDFKEVYSLNNALKGQLIARRVLAEEGVNGRAVTGEELFAKSGKEARFRTGRNVVTDLENMAQYAAIDGVVTKTDKEKVNVFPIYEVTGDVDYSIGNIDFVGSIVIRGSVLNGFKIRAAGDIRVTGGIEAAELEAGGSIDIGAGILGQNKGYVKAGKTIKSSFIQDANVIAGEDVLVTQSIMHSNVKAGRNVICLGGKGLIVGGLIQAGDLVSARTVGNSMATATVFEVGVVPELRNELIELKNMVRTQTENIDKTEKALVLLNQLAAAGQLSPEKNALRTKLTYTRKQALDEVNSSKDRLLEIEKMLENTEKAKVEVAGTIYPGCKIVMGRYTRFVRDAVSRVLFHFFEGEITMSPND